jgi:hypothetical protein
MKFKTNKFQGQLEVEVRAYFNGMRDGVWLYAWWKDGEQFVGSCGNKLADAIKEIDEEEKAVIEMLFGSTPKYCEVCGSELFDDWLCSHCETIKEDA